MTLVELMNSATYKKMSKDDAVFEAWMRACDNLLNKPAMTEERVIELAKLCSDVNKDHRNRLEFSFDDLGLFKFAALIAAEGRVK